LVDCEPTKEKPVVVGIDAPLGWTQAFQAIITKSAMPQTVDLAPSIRNPFLYRETERFLKCRLDLGTGPLTAVGSMLGSQASKAQYMLKCMPAKDDDFYSPPFDSPRTENPSVTIIEVYPTASEKCRRYQENQIFCNLRADEAIENEDLIDALHCALTAACYAATVGLLVDKPIPKVWMPEDSSVAQSEGWIYCPKPSLACL